MSPTNAKTWVTQLRAELAKRGDADHANSMRAYMKSELPYYGVSMAHARKVFRELGKPLTFETFTQFEQFVRHVFLGARYREERYAALALLDLKQTRRFQTVAALPLYEGLIVEGAWWDLVDEIATHRLAPLLADSRAPTVKVLRRWAHSDQLWLRRSAIIAQVHAGKATDMELLFELMEPALHEKEFFLRKAIGWALRSASKHFPREVRGYVDENVDRLSGLSRREALRSLK